MQRLSSGVRRPASGAWCRVLRVHRRGTRVSFSFTPETVQRSVTGAGHGVFVRSPDDGRLGRVHLSAVVSCAALSVGAVTCASARARFCGWGPGAELLGRVTFPRRRQAVCVLPPAREAFRFSTSVPTLVVFFFGGIRAIPIILKI